MVAYTDYLNDARPRREAEALAARGDHVDFVSLGEIDDPCEETVAGVRIIRLAMKRFRGRSASRYVISYFLFLSKALLRLTFLHLRERYQVIHVHTMPDFMVFVALVPRLFGAKVVLDVHDTMPELYMSKFGISADHWIVRVAKFQERISCKFAHRVIAVHDPHKSLLVSRGIDEDRIGVVMNSPDPAIFGQISPSNQSPGKQLKLVYHGTISRRFGLDIALKAVRIVTREYPDLQFDILGDGDDAENIEREIKTLDLSKNVYFSRRFFPVDELPRRLLGAKIGVISNRRDVATEYMLPVKMLEYMFLGIPVVAPRLKVIQYYFDEQCVEFYEPDNHADLGAALLRLVENPELRQRIAFAARERVDRFSWEKMRGNLFHVLDD